MWMLYLSQLIFFVSQKTPCHCSAIYVDAMGVVWAATMGVGELFGHFSSRIVASNLRGEVVFVNIVTCVTGWPVELTSLLDINII